MAHPKFTALEMILIGIGGLLFAPLVIPYLLLKDYLPKGISGYFSDQTLRRELGRVTSNKMSFQGTVENAEVLNERL